MYRPLSDISLFRSDGPGITLTCGIRVGIYLSLGDAEITKWCREGSRVWLIDARADKSPAISHPYNWTFPFTISKEMMCLAFIIFAP
jgi:hypothetical protein